MRLVTLSTGRKILEKGSRDQKRMAGYAEYLDELHVIVFTMKSHGYAPCFHEGNLHVEGTHSRTRIGMLIDAFRIAYRVLRTPQEKTTITAQDPLELGLLSWILGKITHTPFTVQVHGDYFSPYWAEGSVIRYVRRTIASFVLPRAEKIRVVSKRVFESLHRRGIPKERMSILPIRPELESFLTVDRPAKDDDTFVVLTALRFAPEKNIPLLLRAFREFYRVHSKARLRIVGEGKERDTILKNIHEANLDHVVSIFPWSNAIQKEMASADVFVLSSLHESYALVLVEALATGTPVITTDVGCASDLVKDGVHGCVVPVDDQVAFTQALIRMYIDTEFRIHAGMAGKRLAKEISKVGQDVYRKEWVALHTV